MAALFLVLFPLGLKGEPLPSHCRHLPGAREELILTPRADAHLERLALSLSDGVTADQEIYDRLLRDLTAIGKIEARLKSVEYRPRDDGKTLLLRFSETASALFAEGKYHYWDCLNSHYRFESAQAIASDRVKVRFKGIYDLQKLASIYARLPGVISAEPSEATSVDDGANILVTMDEDAWHYVFRTQRAEAFYHFVSRRGQKPEQGGVWKGRASASPAWLKRYWFGIEPQ